MSENGKLLIFKDYFLFLLYSWYWFLRTNKFNFYLLKKKKKLALFRKLWFLKIIWIYIERLYQKFFGNFLNTFLLNRLLFFFWDTLYISKYNFFFTKTSKVISNWFCTPIIFKNPIKTTFSRNMQNIIKFVLFMFEL